MTTEYRAPRLGIEPLLLSQRIQLMVTVQNKEARMREGNRTGGSVEAETLGRGKGCAHLVVQVLLGHDVRHEDLAKHQVLVHRLRRNLSNFRVLELYKREMLGPARLRTRTHSAQTQSLPGDETLVVGWSNGVHRAADSHAALWMSWSIPNAWLITVHVVRRLTMDLRNGILKLALNRLNLDKLDFVFPRRPRPKQRHGS